MADFQTKFQFALIADGVTLLFWLIEFSLPEIIGYTIAPITASLFVLSIVYAVMLSQGVEDVFRGIGSMFSAAVSKINTDSVATLVVLFVAGFAALLVSGPISALAWIPVALITLYVTHRDESNKRIRQAFS